MQLVTSHVARPAVKANTKFKPRAQSNSAWQNDVHAVAGTNFRRKNFVIFPCRAKGHLRSSGSKADAPVTATNATTRSTIIFTW